ncbi:hypothetical protein BU24DRAFT_463339 [Aaosphaeria arxii CBS 175.79]|uniref:Uncharacterized protein n=1 Tax=Aaosphaeria arxii CBS 175.79 TaxID=1450172 RepID=A0A6A5XPA4_9PLEO|nr:uncharacterized protein BU24DRAFT_463339 [Aaosphaeria arxii CBS 175.79]KAF2014560.1 hypothetical protein BU24DRAFT_463339 [Aaosphaeria arxii CBS 175.79]
MPHPKHILPLSLLLPFTNGALPPGYLPFPVPGQAQFNTTITPNMTLLKSDRLSYFSSALYFSNFPNNHPFAYGEKNADHQFAALTRDVFIGMDKVGREWEEGKGKVGDQPRHEDEWRPEIMSGMVVRGDLLFLSSFKLKDMGNGTTGLRFDGKGEGEKGSQAREELYDGVKECLVDCKDIFLAEEPVIPARQRRDDGGGMPEGPRSDEIARLKKKATCSQCALLQLFMHNDTDRADCDNARFVSFSLTESITASPSGSKEDVPLIDRISILDPCKDGGIDGFDCGRAVKLCGKGSRTIFEQVGKAMYMLGPWFLEEDSIYEGEGKETLVEPEYMYNDSKRYFEFKGAGFDADSVVLEDVNEVN